MSPVLLSGCRHDAHRLASDAYIWQRAWTPAVVRALRESDDIVASWHVLGSEMDAGGHWEDASPDYKALAATRVPVSLVIRLDGRAEQLDGPSISARVQERLSFWRAHGVHVAGVEIDHDCATARLGDYRAILMQLRVGLDVPLAITALPAWLDNPDALEALLAVPNSSMLQVHAVLDPAMGLFNPDRAAHWARDYARHTKQPWRLALPSYGTRVAWDDAGHIIAIESERPALMSAGQSVELLAEPQAMANFSELIQRAPPPGLVGLVWFRLPTDDDRRSWSLATWRAVLTHQKLHPDLSITLMGAGSTRDMVLVNRGNADARLPGIVRISGNCDAADGIGGYVLEHDGTGYFLRRIGDGLMRAHFQRNIGWLRCNDASLHVTLER